MIQNIVWSQPESGEPESPFGIGERRKTLKITFHSESLSNPEPCDVAAIDMLRSVSKLPSISAVDTLYSDTPKLTIGDFNLAEKFVEVTVERDTGSVLSGVANPRQWLNLSKEICGPAIFPDQPAPDVQSTLRDILVSRAHHSIGNDILITLSPHLLANRANRWISETNPLTPVEAVKVVGLLLRSQGDFTLWATGANMTETIDKSGFYWVLARDKLPAMWRYHSACVAKCENRQHGMDSVADTSGSILLRFSRALEAKDFIGMQFYLPQSNQTRDCMMYHFDYLTLLLSGVFDALSLVARVVYGIGKPKERNTNFRNVEFVRALKARGGTDVYSIVGSAAFKDLMILLSRQRNSIHGSALKSTGYKQPAMDEQSFVYTHSDHSQEIWEVANRYSSADHWGLIQGFPILFEPYSYATTLVEECSKYVNQIAKATEVERLFSNQNIPQLLDQPPKTGLFTEYIRTRVDVLG